MNDEPARNYAKVLQATAIKHNFDPITGVAIIEHESEWNPSAISKDGEDYGLTQQRARFEPGCQKDADPVNDPSPECLAAKARLLNGPYNIGRMGAAIERWRKLCKTRTGKAELRHILAGYAGLSRPKQNKWCGQKRIRGRWKDLPIHPQVKEIIDLRRSLLKRLSRGAGARTSSSRAKK